MSISSMEIPLRTLAPCSCNSSSSPKIPLSEPSRFENRGPPKECKEAVSSSALLPLLTDDADRVVSETAAAQSNPAVGVSPAQDSPKSSHKGRVVIRKKKRTPRPSFPASSSSSSSSSAASSQPHGGVRHFSLRRRNLSAPCGPRGGHDVQALALPLGMSIAAIVAQVLDRKDAAGERFPADNLSMICIAAVKESVASVFGDRFEGFMRNFETSFGSTLKTLRLLNQVSLNEEGGSLCTSDVINSHLEGPPVLDTHTQPAEDIETSFGSTLKTLRLLNQVSLNEEGGSLCTSDFINSHLEGLPVLDTHTQPAEDIETSFGSTLKTLRLLNQVSLNEEGGSLCTSDVIDSHLEGPPALDTHTQPADVKAIHENAPSNSVNHELILRGDMNQQPVSLSQSVSGSGYNQSALSTFEKSVMEQARSNDLKMYELALVMKRLQLKESQLALSSDSNILERCKLSMGISKASFKVEKFKSQLEDTRHAELLKKCIDCLVAGLLIMSACLMYGAYVYSYKRISEATDSCTSPPKESKSWWVPNPMSSVTSGFHSLKCHATVLSRMLFGVLMILVIAYSLLQRSATSRQTMPVTVILLLLGVVCGFFGKLCVDTLGGSGYCWLLHWETLCLLHFFANVCTPFLFCILHGPLSMSQGAQQQVLLPYWIRRVAFYSTMLLFLPLLCGLMPFASPHDWQEHFSSLVADKLFDPVLGERS
ncbi:protein CPR-5 [Magnolia sinica]|uniref:protein CPR-5 n=1 Tax=Magnolia sinica TaxID=86752 RepID=UPI002657C9F5|nr:protein CPR-5 [Magnolia sinica]